MDKSLQVVIAEPQRIKPILRRSVYRSDEPLRHPKARARASFPAARKGVTAIFLTVFLTVIAAGFSSCSRQTEPVPPNPAAVLQSIAEANPAKYPALQESKHWSNPYLVIRADRVGLLSGVAANEEKMLKPGEVLGALAELPPPAWPYGRAVAILIDQKKTSSEQEKIDLRRNRGIVEGDLQSAHVAIRWIPTS